MRCATPTRRSSRWRLSPPAEDASPGVPVESGWYARRTGVLEPGAADGLQPTERQPGEPALADTDGHGLLEAALTPAVGLGQIGQPLAGHGAELPKAALQRVDLGCDRGRVAAVIPGAVDSVMVRMFLHFVIGYPPLSARSA